MAGWEKYLTLLLTAQAALTREVIRLGRRGDARRRDQRGVDLRVPRGSRTSYYAVVKHGLIGLTRSATPL